MDMDEDDDFYAPDDPEVQATAPSPVVSAPAATETKSEPQSEELEEGEEEDEGGEMDEDEDSVLHQCSHLSRLLLAYTLSGHRNRHRTERWH